MKLPLLTLALASAALAQPPDWENQAVFRINKEAPHATSMPFPDKAAADGNPRLGSPWSALLNGKRVSEEADSLR